MTFKYIFFDLDGTLTDPKMGITNSVMHALRRMDYDVPDRNELLFFIGPPLDESFMKLLGIDHDKAVNAIELYREYYRPYGVFENDVYDGILELLRDLKLAGYKLIMATSKPEEFAKQISDKYGFSEYLDCITGSTMDGSIIKKADVIRLAMDRMNITDSSQCCMVGDRMHDIIGGKTMNMYTISVKYGYGSEEEFKEYKSDCIVDTVTDLRNFFGV